MMDIDTLLELVVQLVVINFSTLESIITYNKILEYEATEFDI